MARFVGFVQSTLIRVCGQGVVQTHDAADSVDILGELKQVRQVEHGFINISNTYNDQMLIITQKKYIYSLFTIR